MNPVISFFKAIVSPITGLLAKKSDNKTKLRTQQTQRIMNAEDKNGELETILSEGMRYSLKDEYWTFILSIALIGCFVPPMAPHIAEGFKVLKTMPDFYQYWLGVSVLTSFGLRIKK